jgi:hypothetical protein
MVVYNNMPCHTSGGVSSAVEDWQEIVCSKIEIVPFEQGPDGIPVFLWRKWIDEMFFIK